MLHLPTSTWPREVMNDREIGRMSYRIALFQRRGMTEREAESWSDRLLDRDRDRDDRRLCIECKHLRPSYLCKAGGASVRDLLQRCHLFTWEIPA